MIQDFSLRYRSLLEDFFNTIAPSYDLWAHGANAKEARKLFDCAAVEEGERVVDVGCGTGLTTALLAEAAKRPGHVMGVDISKGMLDMARSTTESPVFYTQMDAEQLAFGNGNLEVVTLGQVLPYLEHPSRGLEEAFRVLSLGGRVVVSCRKRSMTTPSQELFFSLLRQLEATHPLEVPRLSAERAAFGEPVILQRLLEDAGFENITFNQLVTGVTAETIPEWVDMMTAFGPYPYALITSLGPGRRKRFENDLAAKLDTMEDASYSMHLAYTFAIGYRPRKSRKQPSNQKERQL